MMLWTPHKAIFQTQKISHKNGARESWDIWAKMGPFWDPGDPEWTQYQVKVSGDHESNPGRPMGGSWDQIWSTEVPKRTLYGQNGPFLPLFDRFLKLGGSIWTITVLDEQSIPLRCSGHPTSLYFEKKFPHKIGPWKFRANGHFGPNGALLGPPGAQERPDTRSKCVVTMCPAKAGQSGAVGTKSGPSGPSEDLWGPQKGHFGPKRSLLGPLGTQKGPHTRSKCVVSMILTQTGQSGAVGTKSGPPGPSEDLRGPRKDLLWPKRALFASF